MTKTIVAVVIAVFVLFIIVFSVYFGYKYGVFDWISNLPTWEKGNPIENERRDCPAGFQEIGYLIDNYFFVNSKTNFYVSNSIVYVDLPGAEIDRVIGKITRTGTRDTILLNNDGMGFLIDEGFFSTSYYRQFMPGKEEIKLLNNAFLEGSSICSSNSNAETIKKTRECILTCSLIEGICSSSAVSGRISNTRMDCGENELCYVQETYEKISSGDISLGKESILLSYSGKIRESKLSDILSANSFSLPLASYLKLNILVYSTIPFCYAFDSDKIYMDKGYFSSVEKSSKGYPIISNTWMQSNQNFVQFVAWNAEKNEKVIKRWKTSAMGLGDSGFDEPGNVILDKDFKSKISEAPALDSNNPKLSTFYITLSSKKSFVVLFKGGSKSAQFFQIVKESNSRAQIWAYDDDEKKLVLLKCGVGLYYTINLNSISSSLSQTLDSCSWA